VGNHSEWGIEIKKEKKRKSPDELNHVSLEQIQIAG